MEEIKIDKYILLKKIADGGQGEVFLCKSNNDEYGLNKKYAIKLIPKKFNSKESIKNEVSLLSKIDHPNICKVIDVGSNEEFFYIVLDYIEGVSLREFINIASLKKYKPEEDFIFYVVLKIFESLKHIHRQMEEGILHKDISPHNILLSNKSGVVLIDFGIGDSILPKFDNRDFSGKPSYLPQKFLTGLVKYDETIEMYSLGVIAYELSTGIKVQNENDLDFDLIKSQDLKRLTAKLVNFQKDYEELSFRYFNKSESECKNKFISTLSYLSDFKIITDKTIITPKKNIKLRTKRKTKAMASFFILVVSGFIISQAMFLKRESIKGISYLKNGNIEKLTIQQDLMSKKINDELNFETNSCEMYCYQSIYSLYMGHSYAYTEFKNKNQLIPEYRDNYERFLNSSILEYKKTVYGLNTNLNRCEVKSICKLALSTSAYISKLVPLNIDESTQKKEYDKVMKGKDSTLNKIVKQFLEKPLHSEEIKDFPTTTSIQLNQNGADFLATSSPLNEASCKQIGDWQFLSRTIDVSSPVAFDINSDYSIYIFDKPYLIIKKDKDLILDFKESNSIEGCLYRREKGLLKKVRVWKLLKGRS